MFDVEILNNGGYLFKINSGEHKFTVDAKSKGATPLDFLLASLGSCIGVYARKYAEGAKIGLGDFKIMVKADFTNEKPVYFKKIDVSIDFSGSGLDERRKNALVEFVKNCPVHNTLKNNPLIEVSYI